MPKRQRSWEEALFAMALPFCCQNRVARLSVLLNSVRSVVSTSIQRKSSGAWCTPFFNWIWVPFLWRVRASSSMVLNIFLAPGSARDMERSSLRILCHARISPRRSWRWGGSCMVMATVSMIQPSTFLMVLQEQSPLRSFFRETTGSQQNSSS